MEVLLVNFLIKIFKTMWRLIQMFISIDYFNFNILLKALILTFQISSYLRSIKKF